MDMITYGAGERRILATRATDGTWIISADSDQWGYVSTAYMPGTGMALLFDAHLRQQQELAELYQLEGTRS